MPASIDWIASAVKKESFPPSSNTGGKSPVGATIVQRSIVDYLAFSFPGCDLPADEWIPALGVMFRAWMGGERVKLEPRRSGLYGFKCSWLVQWVTLKETVQLGVVAYGGNGGSCYVSLSGTGCSYIQDWGKVREALKRLCAKLTRVDLAVDYLDGEVTFDQACDAYRAGLFSGSGRPPSHRVTGDLLSPVSTEGRTLYVGKRQSGKLLRAYEKGRQLGDEASEWLRVEVEFRAVDQVLDMAMLEDADGFFAGAYEFCSQVLERAVPVKLERARAKAKIHLVNLLHYAKVSYGRLLSFLKSAGASDDDIVATLTQDGVPARLLESVADVRHQYGGWTLEQWGASLVEARAPF